MSHQKAVAIIVEGRAQHFDPDMVDAFLLLQDEFRRITAEFADGDAEMKVKIDYLSKAIGD